MIIFRTEPVDRAHGTFPDYSSLGNLICSYLSILFGKRFDCHGLVEGIGLFHLPELAEYYKLCNHVIPQNSHTPRKDLEIPLEFGEVKRIEKLLQPDNTLDPKFIRTMQTASKFYQLAQQNLESNPEIAYLHLVTAGEVLSNFFDYDKNELLDEEIIKTLDLIESSLDDGSRIVNLIKSRLLQVKRRFVNTIFRLINNEFFQTSESITNGGSFKAEDFDNQVAAAYDLRSKYVHTGIPFGPWISSTTILTETSMGMPPMVEDHELAKILAKAPTYFGLERIMRFCLLRFAHINGISIDPKLGNVLGQEKNKEPNV